MLGRKRDNQFAMRMCVAIGRLRRGGVGMPVSVAGLMPAATRVTGAQGGMTGEEKMVRIESVIDRLEKVDPNLLVNLEKLATLAETNKPMYDMAVKML